eukprot:scaffold17003_cov130-Skeletonema_dohrnii-CCMP3373.AAC.3
MPSFEDAGARSGYAVEFFCRAKNLADLFADTFNSHYEFPAYWLEGLRGSPILGSSDGGAYSVVSLGGGPGFDYVSSAVATSFCSYMESLRDQEETGSLSSSNLKLHATILDYEEGWGDLVHAMVHSTQTILERSTPTLSCDWGGKCDITQSIFHPSNAACSLLIDSTNLWINDTKLVHNDTMIPSVDPLNLSQCMWFLVIILGSLTTQHKTTYNTMALGTKSSASVASVDAPASFDSEEVPIKGDRAAKAIVAAELRRSL